MNNKLTQSEIVAICLGTTPIQDYVYKHPQFGRILLEIPKINYESIKTEEMILHDDENKLKRFDKNGKETMESPRVTPAEKSVYLTRLVKYAAETAGYDIIFMDGWPYYYNGCFWKQFPEKIVEEFLCLAAYKTGLYYSLVTTFNFKKRLYSQFMSDFPKPEDDESMPTDKILVNLKNGTLEFNGDEFEFRDFRKEDYIRYQLDYVYDPNATSPIFDKFLDEVLPEKAAQDVLMEMIGYCFIPTQRMKLERSLLLHGPGANGKGVVFDIVVAIIGEEHISGFSMESLSNDPNARAQLKDKLLNYATELDGKCKPDMIKKLISGEPVHIKTLYKDVTMMKNYPCKFIFNTNNLPRGAENTNAFFRRWLILPFNAMIPPEKRDIHLSKKLKAELPGIFNRVVAGIQRLIRNEDFTESKLAAQMLEEYKEQSNSVLRFIKDGNWVPTAPKNSTERISSIVQHVSLSKFYESYKAYCIGSGCNPSSNHDFGKKIKEHFLVQPKCTNNETWVFARQELNVSQTSADLSVDSSDDIINQVITDSNEKFKS